MSLLANSNAIEDAGYKIQRSLRFRSSASAYLSRTPASAGSRTTWTWSGWFKRGLLGSGVFQLFGAYSSSTNYEQIYFGSDVLNWYNVVGNTTVGGKGTTQVFRDPSAWYHLVCVTETSNATAADRMRIYVNGQRITAFGTSIDPPSGQNSWVNAAVATDLCRYGGNNYYFDGYLAEVNFVDGQALTPSSFGQTDPVTGVWTPKKYTGTYGTNGFYLPFSDNTSATTLAYDKSGNNNNWTPNNISTTAGATYDSMTDVPTLTGVSAANFATLNPLHYLALGSALSNGNLTGTGINGATSPYWRSYPSTINVSSGKWYCEVVVGTINNGNSLGIVSAFNSSGIRSTYYEYNFYDQYYEVSGTPTAYGVRATAGQIIGMAVDLDVGTIEWFVNGSSQGQKTGVAAGSYFLTYSLGWGNGAAQTGSINFGQRPFSFSAPTGFLPLNTFNLP